MNILMVTPELAPFVKVGGLADVVGALPKELKLAGHDVRILCPLYGSIRTGEDWRAKNEPMVVHMGNGNKYARIWETQLPHSAVPVYFIEHNEYFHRHEVYTGPWGSHGDNDERFAFLSRAGIDLCYFLQWFPDVIHAHDWPTALTPVILNAIQQSGPLSHTASVLTIHNMEHQGVFPPDLVNKAGLPEWAFRADGLESMGWVNMLKGGIYHATKVTTVSPSYAREIQTSGGGCGLHEVLQFRSPDLVGILNGIDTQVWSPEVDPLIPKNYSVKDMRGKAECKAELQRAFNLHVDPNIPVFGVISRLAHQKGLDLLNHIIGRAVLDMKIQFAILGAGESELQWAFGEMPKYLHGRVGSYIGFNNFFAHLIEAGADFFVMPSRFEPCGLNQMYSMAYGTLPIVRATGGLVDSVESYVEGADQGTGFVFDAPTADALYDSIGWACATYYDRPQEYRSMQQRAMKKDFSWKSSAQKYVEVYRWAMGAKGR